MRAKGVRSCREIFKENLKLFPIRGRVVFDIIYMKLIFLQLIFRCINFMILIYLRLKLLEN